MSDAVVDEIFWEFGQRLVGERAGRLSNKIYPSPRITFRLPSTHFIAGWTGNVQLENIWPEIPQADDRAAWYSSCAWLLAKLEIAASAGCIPETPEDRVLDIVNTLAEDSRHPSVSPSWRLGLAKDYVSRIGTRGSERGPESERLAPVMSEYMALVDEFRASEAGRVFLGWAIRSAAPADQRARLFARRIEKAEDDRTSLVLEGASEFRMLIANCYARLRQMDNAPSLRSACWCFHGSLFQQRRAFAMVCAIQDLQPNRLDFVDADNGQDSVAVKERAQLLEHWKEIGAQREELEAQCVDLTSSERWASERTKSSWREVLGQVSVPRS